MRKTPASIRLRASVAGSRRFSSIAPLAARICGSSAFTASSTVLSMFALSRKFAAIGNSYAPRLGSSLLLERFITPRLRLRATITTRDRDCADRRLYVTDKARYRKERSPALPDSADAFHRIV